MAGVHEGADEGGQYLLAYFYSNPLVYEDTDEESERVVKEVDPLDYEEVWLPSRNTKLTEKYYNSRVPKRSSNTKYRTTDSSLRVDAENRKIHSQWPMQTRR